MLEDGGGGGKKRNSRKIIVIGSAQYFAIFSGPNLVGTDPMGLALHYWPGGPTVQPRTPAFVVWSGIRVARRRKRNRKFNFALYY